MTEIPDHLRKRAEEVLCRVDSRTRVPLEQHHAVLEDPLDLLIEWMTWWENTDTAPAKMPNALHVRTAVLLVVERNWKPRDFGAAS